MATRSPNRSAEQWAKLHEQFNDSNERETEFCQRLDVNLLTFRKHRYAANAARKRAAGAFVSVQVTAPAVNGSGIHLYLPGDVRIALTASADMATVAYLVKALQHER